MTVITGASSGVGEAVALRLASKGATVCALGRNAERLAALQKQSPTIRTFTADVRDAQALQAVYETIEKEHGPIETLVNNAAWNPGRLRHAG